jgi:tetratricopeptide (TPR) repeat protein
MIELLLQAESALSLGLLDRAEALYQQVLGADPRNAMAVVGLARVTLERSDEVGALTFARRALAIDPENNAAGRMVQRLEEVLRVRGVAVVPADAPDGTVERQPAGADVAEPPLEAPRAPDHGGRSYLDRLMRRGRNPR